jgi:hypothetical protein
MSRCSAADTILPISSGKLCRQAPTTGEGGEPDSPTSRDASGRNGGTTSSRQLAVAPEFVLEAGEILDPVPCTWFAEGGTL